MSLILKNGIWRPKDVPNFPVEINWNHPLARGLNFLIVPDSPNGLRNLTGLFYGSPLITNGPYPLVATRRGRGLNWSGGSSNSNIPSALQAAEPPTIFSMTGIVAAGTPQSEPIATFQDATFASPTFDRNLSLSSTGVSFYIFSGSALNCSSALSYATGDIVAATATSDASHITAYANGVAGTPVSAGAGYTGYSTPFLNLGYSNCNVAGSQAAIRPTHTLLMFALHGRVLSASEAAWLAAEPFAMLRQKQARKLYVFVPSGGPTNITLTQASWHWSGTAIAVNQKTQLTLIQKSWAWTGNAPTINAKTMIALVQKSWAWGTQLFGVNQKQQPVLPLKAWSWTGNAPGVNQKTFLTLISKSWTWTGNVLSINAKTMVVLAQKAWIWSGSAIGINGSTSIALVQKGWSWTANAASVNAKSFIVLALQSWQWAGNAPSISNNTLIGLIKKAWKWLGNPFPGGSPPQSIGEALLGAISTMSVATKGAMDGNAVALIGQFETVALLGAMNTTSVARKGAMDNSAIALTGAI